jgi:hypothetical protein
MPIEIKELHIRVAVNAAPPPALGKPAAGSATAPPTGGQAADKDAIVAACVEQVLEILKNKAER